MDNDDTVDDVESGTGLNLLLLRLMCVLRPGGGAYTEQLPGDGNAKGWKPILGTSLLSSFRASDTERRFCVPIVISGQ